MCRLSLISLLMACTACDAQVAARSTVAVAARVRVRAEVRVEAPVARAEVRVEAPVPLVGAPVVEFFGVPLEGAADVVFVLDRSGSMSEPAQESLARLRASGSPATVPSKIEVAQGELVEAIERLPDGVRMNVLFFDDELEAFASTFVSLDASTRASLASFAKNAVPDGLTALAPAMRTAFLMNAHRIVLLSDGLGNVGGDSHDILRDAREAMRGDLRIDTIAIGADHDASLLRALATESGGLYQPL